MIEQQRNYNSCGLHMELHSRFQAKSNATFLKIGTSTWTDFFLVAPHSTCAACSNFVKTLLFCLFPLGALASSTPLGTLTYSRSTVCMYVYIYIYIYHTSVINYMYISRSYIHTHIGTIPAYRNLSTTGALSSNRRLLERVLQDSPVMPAGTWPNTLGTDGFLYPKQRWMDIIMIPLYWYCMILWYLWQSINCINQQNMCNRIMDDYTGNIGYLLSIIPPCIFIHW